MARYPYHDSIKPLIEAPINDESIAGYVGLTTEVFRSLLINGHLPPPIDEPGRFFLSPTKGCMEKLLGREEAERQERFNVSHGGVNFRALETAKFYAAMRDRENYMAKTLELDRFLFSYPDLERVNQYDSARELFEEDDEDYSNPGKLYHSLTVERGYSDEEVVSLIKSALERRGVVISLRDSIYSLMQGQKMADRQLGLGTDEFFIQIDPKTGISYEHFLSIHPQCDHSRRCLDELFRDES